MADRDNQGYCAGVNVIGYLTAPGGIGQIARGYARALDYLNVTASCCNISSSADAVRFDASADSKSSCTFLADTINLLVANPHPSEILHLARQIDFSAIRNLYNIGCWWWELPGSVPHSWRRGASIVDELWAGSSFVRKTLTEQFAGPVRLIPPVIEQNSGLIGSDSPVGKCNRFSFLFICDFNSVPERKNPLALVNAFKTAFASHEPAELVIKVRNVESHSDYWQRLLATAAGANIAIVNSELPREDLSALIRACDCYVSLHRSEGFGLTLAEAMAVGKPVVGTAWSGNLDFMTERNSYLVPYQLVKVGSDCRPYSRDEHWADPDVRAAAGILRAVYENRALAQEKGRLAAETIRTGYSVEVVASAIGSVLEELTAKGFQKLFGNKLISAPRPKTRTEPAPSTGNASPAVSICLPVWNGEEYLSEAIESALNQSFSDFELLISDDCSEDSSLEIIRSYAGKDSRIRFWTNERRLGVFANMNRCMERARGQFIKLFAQDDILLPDMLSEAVTTLRSHPEVSLFVAKRSLIDERGTVLDTVSSLANIDIRVALDAVVSGRSAIESCLFPVVNRLGEPSTVMIPRRFVGSGFDAGFYQLGDLDYWFQLLQRGDLYQSSKVLCKFRQHAGSATTSNIGALLFATDAVKLGRKYEPLLKTFGYRLHDFMNCELDSVAETIEVMTDSDFYFGEIALNELPTPIDAGLFRELAIRALQRPTNVLVDRYARRKVLAQKVKVLEQQVQSLLSSRSWLITEVLRGTRKSLLAKVRKANDWDSGRLGCGSAANPSEVDSSALPGAMPEEDCPNNGAEADAFEEELQNYLIQLRSQKRSILRSFSWTITKPLRKVGLL